MQTVRLLLSSYPITKCGPIISAMILRAGGRLTLSRPPPPLGLFERRRDRRLRMRTAPTPFKRDRRLCIGGIHGCERRAFAKI